MKVSTLVLACALLASMAINPAYATTTAQEFFEDAQQRYLDGEYEAAHIQLKNALLEDRGHVESLLLLGKFYLRAGDAAGADYILTQALKYGADPQPTTLLLAEASLKQGDFKAILEKLSVQDKTSAAAAELLGFQVLAYINLGEQKRADKALKQALKIQPQSLMPRVALTRNQLQSDQLDEALVLAHAVTEDYPESARAQANLGLVLHARQEYEAASEAYGLAIDIDPHLLHARINRTRLLMRADNNEEALRALEFFKLYNSEEPRATYLRGVLLSREGHEEAALEEFRASTFVLSNMNQQQIASNGQLSLEAALAHMRLGETESARAYLEAYHIQNADNPTINRLLAALLIAQKEAGEALTLIDPMLKDSPEDTYLLNLKGQAYKQFGEYDKAAEVQLKITALQLGSLDQQNRTTLRKIGAGDLESLPQIPLAAAGNEELPEQESYNLAKSYLIAGRFAEAEFLAGYLARVYPDNSSYLNLLGTAQLEAGQREKAYRTLLEAAARDPQNVDLQITLARIESAGGNHTTARVRLEALLSGDTGERNASESGLVFQLSRIEYADGDTDRAIKLAEQALKLAPTWLELRIFLTRVYLESSMNTKALKLVRETAALNESSMAAQFMLGEVLEKTDELEDALIHYKRMKRRALFNATVLRQISQSFIRLQAWTAADNSLYRALQLEPAHLPTRLNRIKVLINLQRYEAAFVDANKLLDEYPDTAPAYIYRATALRGMGRPGEAVRDQQKAAQLEPTNDLYVLGAFRSLLLDRKLTQAEALISGAVSQQRDTPLLTFAYSGYLIGKQRWQETEKLLLPAVVKWPDNPLLLNNMAIALHQQKRPEALKYAQRAHALGAKVAQINDTLGWILSSTGSPAQGLPYLQNAVRLLPNEPELRYHLGASYYALGKNEQAIEQLQAALSQGGEYLGREDANGLLQSMVGQSP